MSARPSEDRDFTGECVFTASRSSGPGGQNVNKVSTRIELRFDVAASWLLNEEEKNLIRQNLARYLTNDDVLILVSQTERSQLGNKVKVIERLNRLLDKALIPPKIRRSSHPTVASREKRLEEKRRRSQKKTLRKIID